MNEDIVVPLAFFATCVIMGLGIPIVRGLLRKWERPATLPPPASDARLERIEQAIEAMAIEVERIAEGQRFVAKVLAERPAAPVALPRTERADDPRNGS